MSANRSVERTGSRAPANSALDHRAGAAPARRAGPPGAPPPVGGRREGPAAPSSATDAGTGVPTGDAAMNGTCPGPGGGGIGGWPGPVTTVPRATCSHASGAVGAVTTPSNTSAITVSSPVPPLTVIGRPVVFVTPSPPSPASTKIEVTPTGEHVTWPPAPVQLRPATS